MLIIATNMSQYTNGDNKDSDHWHLKYQSQEGVIQYMQPREKQQRRMLLYFGVFIYNQSFMILSMWIDLLYLKMGETIGLSVINVYS